MKNKVCLRKYEESDFQFLHELLSDRLTKKYFPMMYTTSLEETHLRLKTRLLDQKWGFGNRAVIQDFWTRKPVGEISGKYNNQDKRKMELSIVIHPKYRGKGYAKLGTLEFIAKMKRNNPEIDTFLLEIARDNQQSQSTARKLEFRLNKNLDTNNGKKTEYWEKGIDEF